MTQFDPKLLERGLVCQPGSLLTVNAAIVQVKKISYFKGTISTKAKFHITMGHETVMGRGTFFGLYDDNVKVPEEFDFTKEYLFQEELLSPSGEKG